MRAAIRNGLIILLHHTSRREQVILALLVVAFFLSAALSVAGFIRRRTHVVPDAGGSYVEASTGQPRYLNPIVAGNSETDSDINRLVYSGLFRFDNSLTLQPDLAERFELSSDQTEYTVYLKPNIVWHDGAPFGADDVVFTIGSIQTPEYTSPLAASFQGVEVAKIDERTLRFKLKQPYAPFLASLTVGIVPQHVWSHIAPKNALLAEQMLKPVGTGPFQFAELTTKRKTGEITSVRLTRNQRYYSESPYLDEIVFAFFPTPEEALSALTAGKADGMNTVTSSQLDQLKSHSGITIHRLLLPQYVGLFFNQEKNLALKDPAVRSALSMAIDRSQLIDHTLKGEGEPLQLTIPPGLFASSANLPLTVPADIEQARRTLDDAGWKDGDGDGVREKNKTRLHLTITTTDSTEHTQTAAWLKDAWQALGIETEVQALGAGTIQQASVRPREYDILLFGEVLSAHPDPFAFWHSSQVKSPGLNFALLKNKEIDTLLEKARGAADISQREELYRTFQEKILELKPAIILYRPYFIFVTSNHINGISTRYADLPSGRFNEAPRWYIYTKRVWND